MKKANINIKEIADKVNAAKLRMPSGVATLTPATDANAGDEGEKQGNGGVAKYMALAAGGLAVVGLLVFFILKKRKK